MTTTYKQWLDNEYQQFVDALNGSTVENFQTHPMVLRMLGPVKDQLAKFHRWAPRVLAAKPRHICEIGGGSGLFFATLRKMGYTGKYYIFDLPDVKKFQEKYLAHEASSTGLDYTQEKGDFDFCVSLYALGEFDDALKQWYVDNVVTKCKHGLVLWNPHSGASSDILWDCKVEDEVPLTYEGNKVLSW